MFERKRLLAHLDQYCLSVERPQAPFIHRYGSTLTPGTCLRTPTRCLPLLPWLFKERPIGQIEAWLRSHSFSQKSSDIHVLFPGSSWECLFEQKILSVQKLPAAWGWPAAIAAIRCLQGAGRAGGKEASCRLVGDWQSSALPARSERDGQREGAKETPKLLRS